MPPTGRIQAGPPVLAVPLPTEPEPEPPRPPVPLDAIVVVVATDVDDDDVLSAIVEDVAPAAVVDDVASSDDEVDDVDVEVPAAVVLSSARLPGLATARTTPARKRIAAAAPRIANRRFRGDSPRLEWSG